MRRECAVIVGDSIPDLELACNAGVAFCGVLTGQATREDYQPLGATCAANCKTPAPAPAKYDET